MLDTLSLAPNEVGSFRTQASWSTSSVWRSCGYVVRFKVAHGRLNETAGVLTGLLRSLCVAFLW